MDNLNFLSFLNSKPKKYNNNEKFIFLIPIHFLLQSKISKNIERVIDVYIHKKKIRDSYFRIGTHPTISRPVGAIVIRGTAIIELQHDNNGKSIAFYCSRFSHCKYRLFGFLFFAN